jgi:hypothetical protein
MTGSPSSLRRRVALRVGQDAQTGVVGFAWLPVCTGVAARPAELGWGTLAAGGPAHRHRLHPGSLALLACWLSHGARPATVAPQRRSVARYAGESQGHSREQGGRAKTGRPQIACRTRARLSMTTMSARSPPPTGQERKRQDDGQRDHGGVVLSYPFENLIQHGYSPRRGAGAQPPCSNMGCSPDEDRRPPFPRRPEQQLRPTGRRRARNGAVSYTVIPEFGSRSQVNKRTRATAPIICVPPACAGLRSARPNVPLER